MIEVERQIREQSTKQEDFLTKITKRAVGADDKEVPSDETMGESNDREGLKPKMENPQVGVK